MPRKLVNRFFVALPPEGSTGVFGVAEVNTEPPTEASFAPHQAIRPQAHLSGAGAEPHLPSLKGHISQNHINSSGSPKSPSLRYVQKFFEFPQQPASGRPIETFFSNMGTDYKGPLGPPSSLRLSNRVSRQSCTTKHPSSYPLFIGPSNHNRSGGLGTVIKRGSPFRSTGLSTGTRIHQLPFCNTQKGWGPQASDKSKTPKLFHPIRTLQNGVHTHVKRSLKERGLHGENRPQRRISDSPNMAESPKVPKVSVEGFTSGIRMPTLRFSKCPKGIHKIVKTSVVYTETKRNPTHCIPRRYPSYGALSGAGPSACCFDSKSSRGARLYSELLKVSTSSFPTNGVPRVTRKLTRPKPQPPQGQNKKDPVEMPGSVKHPGYYCKGIVKIPGPPVLIHTGSLSSSPPLSVPPTSEKLCSQVSQILRSCSPSRLGMPPRGTVVERQSSSMEWESPVPTINGLGHRDRCLTSRMGSLLSRDVDRRQVAPRRDFIPYQLPRIASRLTSHNVLRQEQSQGSGTTADGQHFSSNLHKQNGRDTLPHAILPSQKSMGLVPHPQYLGDSTLHSRNTECRSGQGIESISRFQRLETSSRGFQPPPSEVGSPQYRPLCLPSLLPTRSVCKLASRPSSNSHGCIHPGLGDLSGLCLSSICPDRPMPSPNSEPAGVTHGVCSTSLASSALVSTTIRPVHRLPSPPTSSGRSTDPGKQNPPSQTPTASWVASVSRGYQTADISAQSREILLAAWRKNTTSAYSSAWTKWSSWCSQQVNVNPLSPSLTNVLDFLALQFHEGKEYRTVNVYRSALSAVLPLIDGHKAGSHPLVCQLLKGVFQLRPPQPRYATTWQVSKLVQYISSLGSNSNLSTKLLSYKLVGLLALTAPDRASGLAARDLRFRYFHPEGVQFKLPELTKTARQGQDPKSCFHASFPENEHLCVCKCLQEYEARTLQWRPQDPSKPNKLLLSHINPHKPVSPATLARWLKELMQLAGVDTSIFKGHSVRGAVATEAAKQGFSIPDILQFADWSQASTFTKFYYRPQFDTSS